MNLTSHGKNCIICGSSQQEDVFKDSKINVRICKKCGLIKLDPTLSKEEYVKFYEREYDKQIRPSLIDNSFKNPDSLTEMLMLLKKANIKINPKKILDIGAGNGEVIYQLKNYLWKDSNYVAIEQSKICVKILKKKKIQVISNDVDSWKPLPKSYDFVSIQGCLEHLLNPLNILKKISFSLKNEGLVYILVPNMSKPDLPLSKFFCIEHTHYFSKKTLNNMLVKSGLKPLLIWEDNKIFNKVLYAVARKSKSKSKTIDSEEYIAKKIMIEKYLNQERSLFYPLWKLYHRLREKIQVPLKLLRLSFFKLKKIK